jgi:hypothetical protein
MTTGRINQVNRLSVSPEGLRSSEDSQIIWRKPLTKSPVPSGALSCLCPDREKFGSLC